ncbi:hypothetical protein CBR_g22306 [Chara braunii]|uniref:Uncharacterized protein n=1 Tax=Chara braunii TaxID=69332 RepID=A0A388L2S5_CHABU|nr:hypothetical protein CBR_g22306 [Chara braunii]|eukprot:GBG76558.1 hypothetical protein CBR_g22306 [Chara braunii]
MLVEVEEAKGIWFVNDQDYNGWVVDDTIEDPTWIWTYNSSPTTKQPDIFPPSDNRWHAVGAKKVTGIPGKIHKDQIIDPRAIKEEKKHEDLLWDMETIRIQIAETCQKTNLDNNTLIQEAKQTLEHRHPKPEIPPALKRNASPSSKGIQEDRAGKKRRATEEGSGSQNEQRRLTQEIATVAAQTKRLFDQDQDYKKENGKKFITVRMIAENKVPSVPKSAATDRGTIRAVRPLIPVRFRSKLNEWQVATDATFTIPTLNDERALAKSIRDNISVETPLGVFGIPPREQTAEGKMLEEPIFTPFDPILVKLDERVKLSEGLTWRVWDTITMLPYNVLNERFNTADIIADSLADIIRTRLLTSKTSLQDEATPIDVDLGREETDMENEEEEEMEVGDKLSPGGDDDEPSPATESSAGEYSLGSSATKEDSRDSDTDSSKTQAAVD